MVKDKLYQYLRDDAEKLLSDYCEDELYELWQKYPGKTDLWIDWSDALRCNIDIADMLASEHPSHSHTDGKDLLKVVFEEIDPCVPCDADRDDIDLRVYNLNDENTYSVGEYWSDHLGDYLSITGQVKKTTEAQPNFKEIAWHCILCENVTMVPQLNESEEKEPNQCDFCERKGPFTKDFEKSKAVDHQLLRLEQPLEEVGEGDGEAKIDVRVEGDLVKHLARNNVTGGSRVTFSGKLQTQNTRNDDGASPWLLEADAVEVHEDELDVSDISPEERDEIHAYANGEYGDPFELLVDSNAPSIYGTDIIEDVEYNGQERTKWWWIKLASALCHWFQGWRRPNPDGTAQRGTSHGILIGDPSTGKSTLMSSIESISPRSASASGKGATKAGLTASAVQDDFAGGQWNLEAGALVKAHRGVATIDEIDKMPADVVNSMHSALEKQRLDINKAGINATLKCETSLLAAGNPIHSRFDDYEDDMGQVDLVASLLDRFDYVFLLKDKPQKDRDSELAEHVIESRTQAGKQARDDCTAETDTDHELAIPEDLLRKWISLSRDKYRPVIEDDEVKTELRDFYSEIRQENDSDGEGNDPVPATVRKLDGALRIAEASARFRLSNTVEMVDAKISMGIIRASLLDIGYDPETGAIDIDLAEGRTSQSQRDRIKNIKGLISELEEEYDEGAPVDVVLEKADVVGMDESKAEHEIDKLKQKGEVYEPSTDTLRTT